MEKGKRDPAMSTVQDIAAALGVPVSLLTFLGAELGDLKGVPDDVRDKLAGIAFKLLNAKQESERPTYPFPPIGSQAALARMLQCSLEELAEIGETADARYRAVKLSKKDGGVRICHDAKSPLNAIQARIKCMILKKVKYPKYLMGGLADPENPRDYVRNASVHGGARVLANEDIAKFFPSTSADIVFDVWRHFFHFPKDVARILTLLTMRDGELPQGAKTSSYLANLAFWSTEPAVVAKLRCAGFEYTRYVDDVAISSRVDRTPEQMHRALSLLASMVRRHGLHLKRSKHRVS